ncbi:NAD(P)/FAD-dependent oxidoreductase [Marinobacter sp.]|uniref:NAD(P)/FAD-dependent oxidoreductase n=1 Tax=Marinobacter sp. TaxID=50741 RepID=UPI00384E6BC0
MPDNSFTPTHIRQVAIIGSGMAGLAAGHLLQDAGVAVTLFEKSRGPGGRLASKRLSDGSVDIGAQFFTVRNPAFSAFLDQKAGEDSYQQWPARLRYQDSEGKWESFRESTRYVGVPRMTAISRRLSESLRIQTQVRIERLVAMDSGQWQLLDTGGETSGPFDAVIITAPPAQTREIIKNSGLKALVNMFSDDEKQMHACWTLAARYEPALELDYDGLQPRSDVLQWAGNNSSKPGRKEQGEWWVLHGRPDWSDEHQDDAPEKITEALLEAFEAATGIHRKPEQTLSHRWLYARSSASGGPGHVWFGENRIAVLGDWLAGGRVEGAFDSAESLINHWQCEDMLER